MAVPSRSIGTRSATENEIAADVAFGNDGESREQAILAAYQHCGRAMIQTTLICGAGLAIFALSDFVPTARFAWMMVALLAAAIVGDLILLPALLLSPFARAVKHDPASILLNDEHQKFKKAMRPRRVA